MLIIFGLLFLILMGIVLHRVFNLTELGEITVAFFSIALIAALIALPFVYFDTIADIQEFKSVEQTLRQARQNLGISQFELAAIQQKIVDTNQWLASIKYWAKHPLVNWYVPNQVLELKPIQ